MAVRVRCPRCGRGLIARAAALGERRTCPACLAEITVQVSVQTESREREASCPHCRRDVEPIWITCPWCEEPLRGRDQGRYGGPDLDVRQDLKGTSGVLVVLAGAGGVGVAILFLNAISVLVAPRPYGGPGCLISLILGLLFLAWGVMLIVSLRSGPKPGTHLARRVVVGVLAVIGAGFAVWVFLFAVCTVASLMR